MYFNRQLLKRQNNGVTVLMYLKLKIYLLLIPNFTMESYKGLTGLGILNEISSGAGCSKLD